MVSPCDILVVGGGVAGLPAAVTAARAGMSTVLVEHEAFLGGTGVTALHRYICGLYLNGPEEPVQPINPGLPREILARLKLLAPESHPLQMGRVWGFPFEPSHLRAVYRDLAQAERNMTQLTSTSVETVQCSEESLLSVTLQTPTGPLEIAPRAVIDATGGGAVIRLSGAPFELAPEPERQPNAITVHFDNIQGDRRPLAIKIPWQLGHLSTAEQSATLPFAGFTPGCGENDAFCKFSIPWEIGHDEDAIRERLAGVQTLLAAHIPELRALHIVGYSRILEREGIRLGGQWELDEAAILNGRKFIDGVVRNAWPIEDWEPGKGAPSYAYPPEGDYYEIPAQCLRSRTLPNLFAAGRCISASSKALSSTRPMGTCMALGEAAAQEAIRCASSASRL